MKLYFLVYPIILLILCYLSLTESYTRRITKRNVETNEVRPPRRRLYDDTTTPSPPVFGCREFNFAKEVPGIIQLGRNITNEFVNNNGTQYGNLTSDELKFCYSMYGYVQACRQRIGEVCDRIENENTCQHPEEPEEREKCLRRKLKVKNGV